MRALRASLGVALLLVGCGDPAVDGTYEGQASFELGGLICATGTMTTATTAMGIAWTTLAPDATRLSTVSGEGRAVNTVTLPVEFELTLFEFPPDGATSVIRTSDGLFDVAIGIPVMFEDLDGDGVLAQGSERVLGYDREELVLYTSPARRATSEVPLSSDSLPRGWSVGTPVCDGAALTGLSVRPADTRYDVWLVAGASSDNRLEGAAPPTCLQPF